MNTKDFIKIIQDPSLYNFKKMNNKYTQNFKEFLEYFPFLCTELPILDFKNKPICYFKHYIEPSLKTVQLLSYKHNSEWFSFSTAENEIITTNAIENIDFNRESVRNILKGMAPKNESENRILGYKQGLEFIANTDNKISEENLYQLYQITVGTFLNEDDRIKNGYFYRHDAVYIIGSKLEHKGISHEKIPQAMKELVKFANSDDHINDLLKAAMIHFYIAYIHPYFDGNGRIARLVHLWFLIQKGYQATLFVPFSSLIEKSKKNYYKAFSQIEENQLISDTLDLTPFLQYFTKYVYNKIPDYTVNIDILSKYKQLSVNGRFTSKEEQLWAYVITRYGFDSFTTKKLEKDFGDAAYATIRSFVIKFEKLELFESHKLTNKVIYNIKLHL